MSSSISSLLKISDSVLSSGNKSLCVESLLTKNSLLHLAKFSLTVLISTLGTVLELVPINKEFDEIGKYIFLFHPLFTQ